MNVHETAETMMNRRRLVPVGMVLSLVLLPLLSACRGSAPQGDPGLVLDLGISPTPPAHGPARLIITLKDTSGVGISHAQIVVEGNMSHAGMVPVLDTAQMQSPGHYLVPDFQFTMPGDWVLTLTATLPDGRTTRLQKATRVTSLVTPSSGDSTEMGGGEMETSHGEHGSMSRDTMGTNH